MSATETIGGGIGGIIGGWALGAVGSFFGGAVAGPPGAIAGAALGRRVGQLVGSAGGRMAARGLAAMMEDANEKAGKDEAGGSTEDKEQTGCVGECGSKEDKEVKKKREQEAKDLANDVERFHGREYGEVEGELDRTLRDGAGWSKQPLRNGAGSRYTAPNGNQVRLNAGYPGSSNVHGGPYVSHPSRGVRVPLSGNPALQGM